MNKNKTNSAKPARPCGRRCRRKAHRDGAAAVEFAFVFPLVLTFFIASIAFFQAFQLRDLAQHAAYKGVRRAIVWDSDNADVVREINSFLKKTGVRNAVVETDPPVLSNSADQITVRVTIPMSENAWIASPLMPASVNPSSQVTISRGVAAD